MTYLHGWLRGLSSILKKVFFGTPYFTAEDALKSKSRRKQLELNFTLKYKWAGHNFEFGNLEGDITEPYQPSPVPHQTHLDTKGLQLLPTTMPWNQQLLQT